MVRPQDKAVIDDLLAQGWCSEDIRSYIDECGYKPLESRASRCWCAESLPPPNGVCAPLKECLRYNRLMVAKAKRNAILRVCGLIACLVAMVSAIALLQ